MAASFPLKGFPDVKLVTTSGTANVATEITLKPGTRRVTVFFPAAAGKVAFDGGDGETIDANYVTVPAGQGLEISLQQRLAKLYVASATTSTRCEIAAEE